MMGTEILNIDASWAKKLTKTRVSFLMTPSVGQVFQLPAYIQCLMPVQHRFLTVKALAVVVSFKKENALVVECPGVL